MSPVTLTGATASVHGALRTAVTHSFSLSPSTQNGNPTSLPNTTPSSWWDVLQLRPAPSRLHNPPSPSVARLPLHEGGATSPSLRFVPAAPSPIGSGAGVAFPPRGESGSIGGGRGAVRIPVRKRYSSSFRHRYGSVGSGGSGESGSGSGSLLVPRERTASGSRSGSFLKGAPAVDAQHADISSFVKDIDAARPLLERYRLEQQQDEAGAAPATGTLGGAAHPSQADAALAAGLPPAAQANSIFRRSAQDPRPRAGAARYPLPCIVPERPSRPTARARCSSPGSSC
ncbi:hypothetical protein FB451DRAFT_1520887 [Mycena latifolia]|nr:hypothetical protein FB451DRAFT_1520887 [Mycena latifolia]